MGLCVSGSTTRLLQSPSPYHLHLPRARCIGLEASDVKVVLRGASTIIILGKGDVVCQHGDFRGPASSNPPSHGGLSKDTVDELDATLAHRWIRPMLLANGLGVPRSRRLTRGVEERWAWNDLRLSHTHDRSPSRNEQCYSMARIWAVALPFLLKPLPPKHLVNLTIKLL